MTPELTVLTLAALLQVVTFIAYAVPANRELGRGYTMSARDRDPTRTMTDPTARLGRAMDNMFEALILFGIAVLVVQVSGQNTRYTATLSWLFLFARVLYVPAYYYAWRPGRSLIWVVGLTATVLLLLAALF